MSLSLTEKGRALHRELFPLTADINSRILNSLSAEDIERLDVALDTLTMAAEHLNQTYPLKEKGDRRSGGNRQVESAKLDLLEYW